MKPIWCGLLLMLYLSGVSLCACAEEVPAMPEGPIEVTSRQMEADQNSRQVVFTGDVVAKRGGMTVYAERLTLFFVEAGKERRIERLEGEGGVRVVDGQRVATAQHLDYLQAQEKMILTGDAQIHQGENLVAGEEIVLFLRDNRSLVKSGKDGRVRAVFLPQQAPR